MLVEYFARRYAEKAGKQISKIDKNNTKAMPVVSWHGISASCKNIVERSVILCAGDTFWIDGGLAFKSERTSPESSGPLTRHSRAMKRNSSKRLCREQRKSAGPNGAAANLEFRGRR